MRVIFTALFAIITLFANAQIQVDSNGKESQLIGKVKRAGVFIAELNYFPTSSDTVYDFMFRNAKYETVTDYQHINFSGGTEVLNQFYDLIKTVFAEENKKNKDYKKQFRLGNEDVLLARMFSNSAAIFVDDNYVVLTEKETDKLFGH